MLDPHPSGPDLLQNIAEWIHQINRYYRPPPAVLWTSLRCQPFHAGVKPDKCSPATLWNMPCSTTARRWMLLLLLPLLLLLLLLLASSSSSLLLNAIISLTWQRHRNEMRLQRDVWNQRRDSRHKLSVELHQTWVQRLVRMTSTAVPASSFHLL